MRIALVAPDWGNSWIPLFKNEVESRGHEFFHWEAGKECPLRFYGPHANKHGPGESGHDFFDVLLHAWATSEPVPGKRNIMFLRRYELFDNCLSKQNWEHVSDLIIVNSWIKFIVDDYFKRKQIKTKTHLIYNAVDTSQWTFKERKPNKRIGMSCHVHPKKNLPLALDIIAGTDYELHIAGAIQDPCTAEYLDHRAKLQKNKVYLYGHIPREQLNMWWEQMGFCLSTSISEGNPNNVLEAMAKGIKPVVHHWPGAGDQFPHLFNTSQEAKTILSSDERYDSNRYLELVNQRFSLDNIKRVIDIGVST